MFYRFMLITQKGKNSDQEYIEFIKKCADGGITSLQLREKHLNYEQLKHLGELLLRILEPYKIPLVINDFPLLAKELRTKYIHIGQKDESVFQAKQLIPEAKLGLSIETLEQLHNANQKELAYVTASAVFPSTNKENLNKIWGLEGLQQLSKISKHPLTAIGGITLENLEDILAHGAQGIALIGAIHEAKDPYSICKLFRDILEQGKTYVN